METANKMLNDEEIRERRRKYRREYYRTHKEKVNEINKRWRDNNKEQFSQIVYNYRRKRAEQLKAKGEKYCWLSDKERQKKLSK